MNINKDICPICGKPNNCAFAKGLMHGGCWCEKISVPQELRELVPENLRGKACICEKCVIEFKKKTID